MKYGDRLHKYSVPEWHTHNILYDDLKLEIKEITQSADSFTLEGYNHLLQSFQAELDNVNLFVQCKLGAIEYSLKLCDKIIDELSSNYTTAKFKQLEREAHRLAHEIENLSKYISSQFTGFRKLLKKFRRHAPQVQLANGRDLHLIEQQIASSSSFANVDLTPQFLELGAIFCVARTKNFNELNAHSSASSSHSHMNSDTQGLNESVDFDVDMLTAQVSDVYRFWVHDDNLVRVKISLLKRLDLIPADVNDEDDITLVEYLDNKDLVMARQLREPAEIRTVSCGQLESDLMLVVPAGGLRHTATTVLDPETLRNLINGTAEVDKSAPISAQLALGWVVSHQAVPTLSIKTKRTRFKSPDSQIYVSIDANAHVLNTNLKFPYSVLELRIKNSAELDLDWVDEFRKSELLYPVSQSFSLYLWALCSIQPNLVVTQFSWLTDLDQGKNILQEPLDLDEPRQNQNSNLKAKKSHTSMKINDTMNNRNSPNGSNNKTRNNLGPQNGLRYWNEFDDGDEYADDDDGQFIDEEEEALRRADVASRLTMPVYQLGETMRRRLHGFFDRRRSSNGTLDSDFAALSVRSNHSISSNHSSSSENINGQYSPRIRPRQSEYGSINDENVPLLDLENQKQMVRNDNGILLITFLCFCFAFLICFLVFMLFFTEELTIVPLGLRLVLITFLAIALLLSILGYIAHNLRNLKSWTSEIIVHVALLTVVCLTVGGMANIALPSVS